MDSKIQVKMDDSRSFGGHGFILREPDGTITRVHMVQGLDLVIEQQRLGQKPVTMSTYSDPGSFPYALMLKFLYMSKRPFPKPVLDKEARKGFGYRVPFDSAGQYSAMEAVLAPFPIQFIGGAPGLSVQAHLVEENGEHLLEFNVNGKHLTFSLAMAERLVEYIPHVYEGKPTAFRLIQGVMLRTIRKEGFEPWKKTVVEKRIMNPKSKPKGKNGEGPKGTPGKLFRKAPIGNFYSRRGRRRFS